MINAVRLRNFKCFEKQSIDFARLTVLSGLNGVGKSSVLQSLLLLRQSFQQSLLPGTGLALSGELVKLGMAKDVLYEGAEEDEIEIGMRTGPHEHTWTFGYEDPESNVLRAVSEPQGHFDTSLFGDDFQYLQAERTGPRVSFEVSEFAVRQHKQVGTRGEYTSHFLYLYGRDNIQCQPAAHAGAASLSLKDQVEAWMGEISPGVRFTFEPHFGMDIISLRVAFAGEKAVSGEFRATNVGFGILYTLPVVTALLAARPSSMLMIENPEAHLHPRGQMKLGELAAHIAEAGAQVVVETHSDHVLNGIRIAALRNQLSAKNVATHFFTKRAAKGKQSTTVLSPTLSQDGRLDSWPDGFFDEWDRSLEILLQAKK